MTRQEAIETVKQVMVELNQEPTEPGAVLSWPQTIVATLIALEVLKVGDDKR